MRNLLIAVFVVLMGAVVNAAPPILLSVKMEFPSGGDTTYRLELCGDSAYRDTTSRVEYYQKDGVWTLRSTMDGDIIWSRPSLSFDIGGGFSVQTNTSKNGAPLVTIIEAVESPQ